MIVSREYDVFKPVTVVLTNQTDLSDLKHILDNVEANALCDSALLLISDLKADLAIYD